MCCWFLHTLLKSIHKVRLCFVQQSFTVIAHNWSLLIATPVPPLVTSSVIHRFPCHRILLCSFFGEEVSVPCILLMLWCSSCFEVMCKWSKHLVDWFKGLFQLSHRDKKGEQNVFKASWWQVWSVKMEYLPGFFPSEHFELLHIKSALQIKISK